MWILSTLPNRNGRPLIGVRSYRDLFIWLTGWMLADALEFYSAGGASVVGI